MRTVLVALCVVRAAAAAGAPASGNPRLPAALRGIGIEQKLNAPVPLDAVFRDERGAALPLRTFFRSRPVLLVPVYYTCPMLCSQILSGLVTGLRPLSLRPGRDFEVVAFSFNPGETAEDARNKRDLYSRRYSRTAGTEGWHFLTGTPGSIKALTEAIGFHYRFDPATKMFVHASGVMVLTPDGRIARYLYGVEYAPKDLKLGLIEASNRTIGSPVDRILLFCYHYDPATGKYGAVVLNILRLAGAAMLLFGGAVLGVLWRLDLIRDRHHLRGA